MCFVLSVTVICFKRIDSIGFNLLDNIAELFMLSVSLLYSVSILVLAFRLCMNSCVGHCP